MRREERGSRPVAATMRFLQAAAQNLSSSMHSLQLTLPLPRSHASLQAGAALCAHQKQSQQNKCSLGAPLGACGKALFILRSSS